MTKKGKSRHLVARRDFMRVKKQHRLREYDCRQYDGSDENEED